MAFVVRYLWFFILVALLCASCASGPVTPTDTESSMTVKTSIGGVVVDEKGEPIAGATVTAHGATTRTNIKGVYIFKNLIVPRDRACVIASKDPFLTSVRTEWPSTNGTTSISLVLQTKRGGSDVNGPNGARV